MLEDDLAVVADDQYGSGKLVLGDGVGDEDGCGGEVVGLVGCWLRLRLCLGGGDAKSLRRGQSEQQKQERGDSLAPFGESQAKDGADEEGRKGTDEDVPGEGDLRNGHGSQMHRKGGLPESEIEGKAADHAENRSGLGCVAGERAEQEDAQQAAIGDRGNAQPGFDDVAFASVLHGVNRDGEEDHGPKDRGGSGEQSGVAVLCGSR